MLALLFVMIVALLGAFLAYWQWQRSSSWLPAELRRGKMVGVEKSLHAEAPFPVTGRLDRVYQLANGLHTPMEFKNRDTTRLHDSDLAQLSLQSWLLRRNGHKTASFGYLVVRERKTGRKKALKVNLRDDAYCDQLIRRYLEVQSGMEKPRKVRDGRCKSCGHYGVC